MTKLSTNRLTEERINRIKEDLPILLNGIKFSNDTSVDGKLVDVFINEFNSRWLEWYAHFRAEMFVNSILHSDNKIIWVEFKNGISRNKDILIKQLSQDSLLDTQVTTWTNLLHFDMLSLEWHLCSWNYDLVEAFWANVVINYLKPYLPNLEQNSSVVSSILLGGKEA